jgi:copper(I)-binding protein
MSMQGGIMRMRLKSTPIDIPAGATLMLADSGFHIMLIGLKERPKAGGTMPIRLTFEKAGTLDATLPVLPIGAKGPPGHSGQSSSHDATMGVMK